MKQFSDPEYLKQRLRLGCMNALNYLHKEHFYKLIKFALMFTRDIATAEDIASETIHKVWEKREMLDDEGCITAFMYGIARKISYKKYREDNKMSRTIYNYTNRIPKAEYIDYEHIQINENDSFLIKEIMLLSKQQRAIIMLTLDNNSIIQISELLGKPYDTIKAQKSRATITLKKRLRKYKTHHDITDFLSLLLFIIIKYALVQILSILIP